MSLKSSNMNKRFVTAPLDEELTIQGTVHLNLKAALKDGDIENDFNPENRNDADSLTMKLGDSKVTGRMDDVKLVAMLYDVCDEKFDSIQTVDPERNIIPVVKVQENGVINGGDRMDDVKLVAMLYDVCDEKFDSIQTVDPERNIIPVVKVQENGVINGGDLPSFDLCEFETVHKNYRPITRAYADLCNPEAGYEPETAINSIELKKGEYHEYNIYLNATRYTVKPGHSLALVITTEDPVNCLIHKTYSVEIDNASVNATVPVTAESSNLKTTIK